ncbi:hypothetical protein SKAU_G00257220 [Synaphobranchus kaupii]|uniref:Uncharacterized protein n=1 Tax=Synaphobranchus kaupii TaxID=118154 RepID=A0A9Q1F401_SYNKA|nr:hypothetical protein SKAU_G00257220 [Synaphobranchus kaupii]
MSDRRRAGKMEEVGAEGEMENAEPLSAEKYAAEAMAADMDPWIVFDARKTPRAEFDGWLESNRPSLVSRHGDEEGGAGPVGWIAVLGPDHCPSTGNVTGLQEGWERLLASGRPVGFQTVKELALNHGVLTGKWLMHLETGFKVDHAWESIARSTLEGKISLAKVSPRDPKSDSKHVICAYNQAFTQEDQVMSLDAVIRAGRGKMPALLQARRIHVPGYLPEQPLEALPDHLREQVRPRVRPSPIPHRQQSHRRGGHIRWLRAYVGGSGATGS